jgi:hypothetical protein
MERFTAMDVAADRLVDAGDALDGLVLGHEICRTDQSRAAAREIWKQGITTATFFLRGPVGIASTAAASVLSEMKPGESPQDATIDGALGLAKGLGTRAVFCFTAKLDPSMRLLPIEYNLPARAVTAGIGCRAINTAFTRDTWNDCRNGQADLASGAQKVSAAVFDPRLLCMDVAAMGIASGFSRSANVLSRGELSRSPMMSTSVTGAGFGFSSGAGSEVLRQDAAHENFDIAKTVRSGFTGAAIGGIAAIPGGLQAESEAVSMYNAMNMGKPVQSVPNWRRAASEGSNWQAHFEPRIQFRKVPALARNADEHDHLALPVEDVSLLANQQRLQFVRTSTEPVDSVRPGWSAKVPDYADFKSQAITSHLELHRIYKAQGHDAEIHVPERHYRSLEPELNARLQNEAGKTPALPGGIRSATPADMVDLLDGLPNSRLVRGVYLYGHDHPDNAWQGGHYTADANSAGYIRFFNPKVVDRLRTTMNHEWSHLVHYRFPEQFETFKKANRVEDGLGKGYNAREYARTDDMENFAVHMGEKLMHPDPYHLLEIAEQAPLRTAVLSHALRRTVDDLTPAEQSKFLPQYRARIDFVSKRVIPKLKSTWCKETRAD